MSRVREQVLIHAAVDELRLARARVDSSGRTTLDSVYTICGAKDGDEERLLTDQTVVDAVGEYVREQGLAGRDVIVALGGGSVACQFHEVPPLGATALRQAVRLKLAQQLHFDVAEAITGIDRVAQISRPDGPRVRTVAVAARKSIVQAVLDLGARTGLRVASIVTAPGALASLARECAEDAEGLRAVLHVDERSTLLVVLENRVPCLATELGFGCADLTAALMRPIIAGDAVIQLDEARACAVRDRVGIPAADAEIDEAGVCGERIIPLLEPTLQKLTKQLTQWLTFASVNANRERAAAVDLIGPGAAIPRLAETIGARLGLPCAARDWRASACWLRGEGGDPPAASLGVVAAAARFHGSQPDLIPRDVRRQRTMTRVRRIVAMAGVPVAAAIFIFGVLVQHLAQQVDPMALQSRQHMMEVQRLLGVGRDCEAKTASIRAVERDLAEFAGATPQWLGLFKELSVLLPEEFQATEVSGRSVQDRMRITITGAIRSRSGGRPFEEVVRRTLVALEQSPFFRRVQPVSSNQETAGNVAGGTLTIELEPSYPANGGRATG